MSITITGASNTRHTKVRSFSFMESWVLGTDILFQPVLVTPRKNITMKKVLPRISVTKIGEFHPKEDNEEYVGFKSLSDADVIKNKKIF